MGVLDGKVAIITGGAGGQGEAEARLFVREGARVAIADVDDERGKALAHEIGDATMYVHLDVSSETSWLSATAIVTDHFGPTSVLVNNAAIHWMRPLEQETVTDLDRIIAVNLRGTFLAIRSVVPSMRAAGGGSIIAVSSTAGMNALPNHFAYGATKWAVRGISRQAALEFAPDRIRVNCIVPGGVDTTMARQATAEMQGVPPEEFTGPVENAARPEQLADVALFLASDQSSRMTGAELLVDGGLLLGTDIDFPTLANGSAKGHE